ncbi:hypothetical protein [Blastococcus sp. SYSU DS0541]
MSYNVPQGPEMVPPPRGSWKGADRPASFDELLEQGKNLAKTGNVRRDEVTASARAKAEELEEWRAHLRELGRWFAGEARAKGLRTSAVELSEAIRPAPEPPKRKRSFSRSEAVSQPPTRRSVVRRGWALFPLDRSTGEASRAGWTHYGGTRSFDTMINQKIGYYCLAVDETGEVRVGLEEADRIRTSRDNSGLVGATPDELTPAHLAMVVNRMSTSNSWRHSGDVLNDPELLRSEVSEGRAIQDGILGLYVAYAHHLLEKT